MPSLRKLSSLILAISIVGSFYYPNIISAQITQCDAVVNPTQVTSGATTNFTITVTNGSASRIRWLTFSRPSTNFSLSTLNASGWVVVAADANSITVNGNTINTGVSRVFTLENVAVANLNAPSADWIVAASHDGVGSSPYNCTGTLGTQIGTPDTNAPAISGITVSNITSTSANVSWITDEMSSSRINFGQTAGYGSNVNNNTLTTNHSLSLTNLSANTGYHFQVQSTDASNNTATSSDNTFLTAVSTTTTTTTTTVKPPSITGADTTVPTVILTTNFQLVYKEPPTIFGSASDNVAIQKIEYSTDGGENWLPVDKSVGINSKQVSFEFKALGLPDGNYDILVRAYDSSDNLGLSANSVLIIDNLPPLIGPNTVIYGAQVANVRDNIIYAVIGVDQRIVLSTIGGPTSVVLKATSKDEKTKFFSLTKEPRSTLWSGIMAFEDPGSYLLTVTAKDGAGNSVTQELNNVLVNKGSQVLDTHGKAIADAKVEANYYDPESSSWYLWDAASFGQTNPQRTNKEGEFNYFLPAGKYYLRVEKDGYYPENSEIFTLSEGLPLTATIALKKRLGFKIGDFSISLPKFSLEDFEVTLGIENLKPERTSMLVTKRLPSFKLQNSRKESVNDLSLAGKKTLLVFIATWLPNSEEQIAQLEQLAETGNYNIFLVVSLESYQKVSSYKRIGDYNIEFLVDPEGVTLSRFNVLTIPYHIIVGTDLNVGETKTGVFSKKELQEALDKH